jgi:hypothetical protein
MGNLAKMAPHPAPEKFAKFAKFANFDLALKYPTRLHHQAPQARSMPAPAFSPPHPLSRTQGEGRCCLIAHCSPFSPLRGEKGWG